VIDAAPFIIGWLGFGILIGGFCAYIAAQKGRSGGAWFFLGLLFGILALVAIAAVRALEKKEKQPEAEKITAEPAQKLAGVLAMVYTIVLVVCVLIYLGGVMP
jgi:hypothetical protein